MSDTINDMTDVKRVPPVPRSFSRAFWEATREKKLLVQYCKRSGQYQFFPRPTSIFTGRRDLEWREVSGKGKIFTYTIVRRAREPFQGHEPFFIATITLDVGVNILANVVRCPADKIRIDMPVRVSWQPLANGTNLPVFEPDL